MNLCFLTPTILWWLNVNRPFKRKRKGPEMTPLLSPLYTWTDEDQAYVDMMLKKNIKQNFGKRIITPSKEKPQLFEYPKKSSITPIKNCRKCYFAASVRTFGLNWFVKCSNIARSRSHNSDHPWILAKRNLPCWR